MIQSISSAAKNLGLPIWADGADYGDHVQSLRRSDASSRVELVMRLGIIFLGMVASYLASGDLWIVGLLSGYLISNMLYSHLLISAPQDVSYVRYVIIISLYIAGVTLYSLSATYLFTFPSVAFKVIAISGAVAQAMYNLSRHHNSSLLAIYDTCAVAACGMFFGLSYLMYANTWAETLVIVVSTVGVAVYLFWAQFRSIQAQQELRASRNEAVQAQKMRAVGQLTAGIAHDFNNLLTVIRGNIELAEVSDDKSERDDMLAEARKGADRAAGLTSQLLMFSRKARLTSENVSVNQFFDDLSAMSARVLPASIEMKINVAGTVAHLHCDPVQLETALLNLMINARDALNDTGEITITCRAATHDDMRRLDVVRLAVSEYAALEVHDDGPGIPPDMIASVTEPFMTTKPVGHGSGLGLSMVKGFTEQSGGGMFIDSNTTGTRVTLVLPQIPFVGNRPLFP